MFRCQICSKEPCVCYAYLKGAERLHWQMMEISLQLITLEREKERLEKQVEEIAWKTRVFVRQYNFTWEQASILADSKVTKEEAQFFV